MRESIRAGALAAVALVAALGCAPSPTVVTTTPAPVYAAAAPVDVTGGWNTQWGAGQSCYLELQQNGNSVTGSYTTTGAPPGTVSGTIDGNNVLTGTWGDQGGGGGGMQLSFSPDGRSFTGTWGSGGSYTSGGTWNGQR